MIQTVVPTQYAYTVCMYLRNMTCFDGDMYLNPWVW